MIMCINVLIVVGTCSCFNLFHLSCVTDVQLMLNAVYIPAWI